jgi:hypothetical protein
MHACRGVSTGVVVIVCKDLARFVPLVPGHLHVTARSPFAGARCVPSFGDHNREHVVEARRVVVLVDRLIILERETYMRRW